MIVIYNCINEHLWTWNKSKFSNTILLLSKSKLCWSMKVPGKFKFKKVLTFNMVFLESASLSQRVGYKLKKKEEGSGSYFIFYSFLKLKYTLWVTPKELLRIGKYMNNIMEFRIVKSLNSLLLISSCVWGCSFACLCPWLAWFFFSGLQCNLLMDLNFY